MNELWISQVRGVLRLELRKSLLGRRALPIYLVGALPVFPVLLFVIVSTFAVVALALSLLGIYGILAYSVARRRAEIGVRVALGATERSIARMVVRQGMTLVLVGTALGLVGAAAGSRLLASQLFGISPLDSVTFLTVTSTVLAVAFLATLVPAARAARTDPAVVLAVE